MRWGTAEQSSFIAKNGTEIFFTKKTAQICINYYVEASKFKSNIVITLFQMLYDYGNADYPEYEDSVVHTWKVPISEISTKWKEIKEEIMKHVNNERDAIW